MIKSRATGRSTAGGGRAELPQARGEDRHPPGSDGRMATALKRFSVGWVLVFVVGAFAEMSEDVSRICDIIAHDLARTHVSYYNDDSRRTKGMCRQRIQKAWGHTAHRGWARLLLNRARGLIIHGPAHRGATARRCRRTRAIRTSTSFLTTPRGVATPLPRHAQPLLLLFRSNPPQ